ncbi:MAG: quinolinate synthase NadA [Actinobacteria bacterium]|nr:MAG: quinolinate synthase NadA [Actinomycetota bacterium]
METFLSDQELVSKIKDLASKKDAVILAHNYQRPEIQDIADYVGDSLGLSRQAASTDADIIIFCGVHFMAETAYILSPQKTVILPEIEAGCPMADMATAEQLKLKKNQHQEATVVTYVNSSAAVKAESDICCTSSNAVKVVESLNSDDILFVPDKNLGAYVAKQTGKNVILWDGFCPTHHHIRAGQILALIKEHPQAVFMAHPECTEEVLALANHIDSTSGMFSWAKQSDANEIIVGSEMGMLHRLQIENPNKIFYPASNQTICPNMKLITLDKVYDSLLKLEPKITVPEQIRLKALEAVDKMVKIG